MRAGVWSAASWPAMGSTGEAVLFWCVAALIVLCALGVLFFRQAVYAAVCTVGVMLGLALLFFAQGAPFLGAVQVIVYTGAVMMLFVFVIMMVGIGTSDDYNRQSRANIVLAVVGGAGLAAALIAVVVHSTSPAAALPAGPDPYSNEPVTSIALSLFQDHWLSIMAAGVLLVTAAVGAMLLGHADRLGPKLSQRATAQAKMLAYRERGRHIGQLPAPGVYAVTNAANVPAISGETAGPVEQSVPRVLRVRGLERTIGQVEPHVAQSLELVRAGRGAHSALGPDARVGQSGAWGMPGPSAPRGLGRPETPGAPGVPAGGDEPHRSGAGAQGSKDQKEQK